MKRPILTILILGSLTVVLSFMMRWFETRQQSSLKETQQPHSAITAPGTGNPIVEIHTQKNP